MYKKYVSVDTLKEKATKTIKKLSKKQNIQPLVYQKTSSWWALKWEDNIKKYSDFSNRIARGRSYAKNGLVIDFKINEGEVDALVIGSRANPYEVSVSIDTLSSENIKNLENILKDKISNLETLIKGDFPKELEILLLDEKLNLFPKPKEINFCCNCPDYAHMCKHVSAVLIGVTSKLSENPLLFFSLRGINTDLLIKKSVEELVDSMLENSENETNRAISEDELSELFNLS